MHLDLTSMESSPCPPLTYTIQVNFQRNRQGWPSLITRTFGPYICLLHLQMPIAYDRSYAVHPTNPQAYMIERKEERNHAGMRATSSSTANGKCTASMARFGFKTPVLSSLGFKPHPLSPATCCCYCFLLEFAACASVVVASATCWLPCTGSEAGALKSAAGGHDLVPRGCEWLIENAGADSASI
jgi:hypothetical protein